VSGVGLADADNLQLIAFKVDRVGGQQFRQDLLCVGRNLPGKVAAQ
jgi:hypothetical protein